MNWNGNLVGFPNIQLDNIMIVGAVYENVAHQAYSYPPSSNPFNAYYVDDSDATVPHTLTSDKETISETGGTAFLTLFAGVENANRNYIMLGGLTGSSPGFALPGGLATMPLNWDPYTDLVLSLLNSPVFSNFLGTLGASGTAFATLNVPALPPGLVGTVMTYAYALNNPFDFASTPVQIEIVP